MVMDEKVVVVVVHGEEGSCLCTLSWRREEGWGGVIFYFKSGTHIFVKIVLIRFKGYFSIFHLPSGQNEPFLLFSGQNETVYYLEAKLILWK